MDKTTKLILGLIVLAVVILGIYTLATGPKVEEARVSQDIKIGFMGPLTGDAASYGESIKRGVEMAILDSGLENYQASVIFEDSKCEGKEAVNAFSKLISVDRVVAVVGEVCSGATLAAAPVANENKVPLVSAASTSPKLSESGEYIFRTVPSDALQGRFGAQLVWDRGHRRLAILYSNEEYGVGFTEVLSKKFQELGGQVVASESFERNATDVRTQLTKIRAQNPDAIYIISNSPSAAVAALRQMSELRMGIAKFGSEGLRSPDILEGAKEAASGLIVTSVSSGTSGFIAQHNAVYGQDPGPFAAQGYDALMAIARAIQQGARTGDDIKNALFTMEFDGASGYIDFDASGDVSGNYDVFEVRDSQFQLVPAQ